MHFSEKKLFGSEANLNRVSDFCVCVYIIVLSIFLILCFFFKNVKKKSFPIS